jgi:ketosteroid isomerase-like protein
MSIRTLLFAAAIAFPVLAQAPDGNAGIRAAADAFIQAQERGDAAALEQLIAPDFLFVRSSGRVGDRREFITGFTAPGNRLEPFRITDRMFVRASPDVAIVGGEAWIKGTEAGKPLSQHFRYSDTLARRDGRWLVVFTQVTPLP